MGIRGFLRASLIVQEVVVGARGAGAVAALELQEGGSEITQRSRHGLRRQYGRPVVKAKHDERVR